jgi:hypothetical protein
VLLWKKWGKYRTPGQPSKGANTSALRWYLFQAIKAGRDHASRPFVPMLFFSTIARDLAFHFASTGSSFGKADDLLLG